MKLHTVRDFRHLIFILIHERSNILVNSSSDEESDGKEKLDAFRFGLTVWFGVIFLCMLMGIFILAIIAVIVGLLVRIKRKRQARKN